MDFLLKWRWEFILPFAGILLTLAFSPFNYSFFALVSLLLVYSSWLNSSPLRVFFRGYLYGLGLFGSGIYWVFISIHDYGGAPVVGAFLLTLLVVLFWALFPALTGYFAVKIAGKRNQQKLIWIIPFIWILMEYFRGAWLLNGFPWLQLAYTQMQMPLQGFVPLVGVYGTGFLLALSASIIIAWVNKILKLRNAVLMFSLLWLAGSLLQTVAWTEVIGEKIRVALIQGNVAQDQKWLLKNRQQTLLNYQQMSIQNWDADIIVWPETAIPAYLSQVKEFYLTPLSAMAKAHDTDIVVSLPAMGKQNEYFNTVLTLGKNEGRYNKNHLLPFGEYLPLQPVSGFILDLLNIQLGNFSSGGTQQQLLQAAGYPFATSICYEDAFGDEAIRAMPRAAFLLNVTNDAWFGNSIEPHQHMQLAQMRALETGRYMIRTTNTGITAIVAPDGTIVKKAAMFTRTVLKGEIFPMGGITPYARLGDGIIMVIMLFCLIILLAKQKVLEFVNEI